MSLEEALPWIGTFLAGMLSSWLQERFKGTPLGRLDQRLVALGLAILLGILVWGLQFQAGVPLFRDVADPWDIVRLIAAFLLTLGGSQTMYGFRYARSTSSR